MDEEKTTEAPKEAPKRGRRGKSSEAETFIGLEIVCESGKHKEAAEAIFFKEMDEVGGMTIVNPACGGSIRIKSFADFPLSNIRCTCGQPGHFAIKYTVK